MDSSDCLAIKDIKPGMQNINVKFIVLEVGEAITTKDGTEIRNFKVADHSACINVGIWNDVGQSIAPGDIIKLTRGYATIWRQCLTLYSSKKGEVYRVGDFCMVFNEQLNMSDPARNEKTFLYSPAPTNKTALNDSTSDGGGVQQN